MGSGIFSFECYVLLISFDKACAFLALKEILRIFKFLFSLNRVNLTISVRSLNLCFRYFLELVLIQLSGPVLLSKEVYLVMGGQLIVYNY